MYSWEKIDENTLPLKEAFYSTLNLEDISNDHYAHAQKVWDVFEIKYHDLYVQSDTLLLADVFENFRNMCRDIYGLDPTYFVSAPGLAWQACLKKTGVKLELLTDYDMILMIEKEIRGGICQATHRYAKANNKYMKDYDKNIKCLTNSFKWVEDLSKFNESFIKNYDENIDTGYFLEVDINYPKRLFNLHKDLPFLPERKKLKKSKNLFAA